MRVLSRLLLIRLVARLSRGNSMVQLCSFSCFQFIVCFSILLVNLIAFLLFNLSYLTEDYNHKSVYVLASLAVNLLPIYNLTTMAMRLLFEFRSNRGFACTRIALEFDPKEITRSFLVQEVGLQSYFLLFVWLTRYRSTLQDGYGNALEAVFI